MPSESKKKNYTFKCPCCGCEDLAIKTCIYVYTDVQSLELKSIAGSEFKYYSYEPGDQCTEQVDEAYGEILCCDQCGYEVTDIEDNINDNVITISDD